MADKIPVRVLFDDLGNPTGLSEFQPGETIAPIYLPAASGGGEPVIVAGTTTDYWRGDKTWHNLQADVRNTVATGMVLTDPSVIAATDTYNVALGKAQAQITQRVVIVAGMGLSSNDFTATLLTKLNGIADGATVNSPDAFLLDRGNHTGTQAIGTIVNLQLSLDAKVDKVAGMGLSTNDFTDALKTKLAGLDSNHFRGTYTTLASLTSGATSPVAGDYADVDAGAGSDVQRYIWDVNDAKWVAQAGTPTALTAAQVKTLYESNPDTNAFTGAYKTKLDGIAAGAQVNTITTVAGRVGAVVLAKGDVGLGNADNTADSNKPVSTPQQTALDTKEPTIAVGTAAQYWNGLKAMTDFATSVRNSVLTGFVTTTNTVIVAADSVIVAFGKAQAQITAQATAIGLKAAAGANSDITAMSAFVTLTAARLTGKLLSMVGYIDKTVINATATGTVTLDCSLGSIFDLTLTGNTTLAFSNVPTLSGENFAVVVKVRQGTTAYTLTQPSGVTPITTGSINPVTPAASKRADYVYSTTTGTAWDWYAGAAT